MGQAKISVCYQMDAFQNIDMPMLQQVRCNDTQHEVQLLLLLFELVCSVISLHSQKIPQLLSIKLLLRNLLE
jgi:hypothetical protein